MNKNLLFILVALSIYLWYINRNKSISGSAVSNDVTTIMDDATGKTITIQNADINNQDIQDALNYIAGLPPSIVGPDVVITVTPNELHPEVNIVSIDGLNFPSPSWNDVVALGGPSLDIVSGGTNPADVLGGIYNKMPFECISYIGMENTPYGLCPNITDFTSKDWWGEDPSAPKLAE
jgi:hypothetical protein